jgi:hypothetical protein
VTTPGPHPEVPSEVEPRSIADLVADAADVTRHLREVPRQRRVVTIPEPAVAVVQGLDEYGD